MYTNEEHVRELEDDYGRPVEREMEYEIASWEHEVVVGSMRTGRAHDVTFFIRDSDDPGLLVVVSKPFFPPGAFRAPSGAAHPGETLVEGAVREAHEETGLDIELTRYLVRIKATFTCEGREPIDWTTHIVEARRLNGSLDPIDTDEIAEARWASFAELQGPIRQILLDSGWDLFRYRVALTDLAVETLGVGT
jgi:8-oxo-dGTP pyrophosphatase MutT (NUDIX family)